MKNLILIFFTSFILCCCYKDNDKPKTELEKLPPATQTGANKAGCLVNGVAFLPKGYFTTGNLTCNYNDGKNFSLLISEQAIGKFQTVFVSSYNQNLHDNVNVIFPLKVYGSNSKAGEYIINATAAPNPNYYSTTETITGEVKITYHNFDKAIMSGTFWFDGINSDGEIIKVREGRFDMHY